VADGRDEYRIIDKTGTVKPYVPPWSTQESNGKKIVIGKTVSNSCNGMMLFPYDNSIFLFNPETRYFQKVLELDSYNNKEDYYTTLGLCYDPSINDYKALVSFRGHTKRFGFACVASLKGKEWTYVNFPFQFVDMKQGPVFNGRLHLIVQNLDVEFPEIVIACFDPSSNEFIHDLSSPPVEDESSNVIMGLAVMEGCLWMTRWRSSGGCKTGEVEVFKMKEYGVRDSWTLMFVYPCGDLNPNLKGMSPLLAMENGRIMFSKLWAENTNCGYPVSVPFVKNSASPEGYNWDPIEHHHFGHFDIRSYYNR
jgi:F-box interacting protein